MTNKLIILTVIVILLAGLVFLGTEVQKLRSEVNRLSRGPVRSPVPVSVAAAQRPARPKTARNAPAAQATARPPLIDPWDPYADMARIQGQMDQLFNQAFRGGLWSGNMPAADVFQVSSDIRDEKDKYVVSMDIPGMDKNNINVEVRNNALFVSGERKSENEESDANYYKQERSFGYFSQSLPLPADADASSIAVNYDKGVLTVDIPKQPQTAAQAGATKIKVN